MSLVVIPILVGMGMFFYFDSKMPASLVPISIFLIGVGLTFTAAFITIYWENDYNSKVSVLINDAKCSELPLLAITYPRFEDKIVNKIVIECLSEPKNQELIEFVRQHFNET